MLGSGGLVYNLRPFEMLLIKGSKSVAHKDFSPFSGPRGRAVFAVLGTVALFALSGPSAAQGSADAGQAKSAVCAACHGPDGNSPNPVWPSLAGQHATYIARQIAAFKAGDREDALMSSFATQLDDADVADVAAYFESQARQPRGADPALVDLGESIYRSGAPDRGVPACIACHGPAGKGNPLAGYPVISGQYATYIANTLHAYADGTRRSDASINNMMQDIAAGLNDEEIEAVASYMQGLH
jgi:cytochrome c553